MAVAEEAELGAVFVRQQFRGAQVSDAHVIASDDAYPELESVLAARLDVPVSSLPVAGLPPGAIAAFGAVLDARSLHPVSLGGRTLDVRSGQAGSPLQLIGISTLLAATLVGVWAIGQAFTARGAGLALADAQRRVEQESSTLAPARETAVRRKLVREATAAMRSVRADRSALQQTVASVAGAVPDAIALDSIAMEYGASGWHATLGGTVRGRTSGAAVQSLSAFHAGLSRLAPVESLTLKQLSYSDTVGQSLVRFEMAFRVAHKERN